MQALNQKTASLQEQIVHLEASGQVGGKQLAVAIINANEIIQEIKNIAKKLNNGMLVDFLNANTVILQQLLQFAETANVNNQLLNKSTAVMQQLAIMYQDAIVPMLTRLHNLSEENSDIQRITAITSLGNEIITYSAQMNQFSEKFALHEKTLAIFGVVLMLSSISMMVVILSRLNLEISLLTALVVMALGCAVCKKTMQEHLHDPGTDLIVTSVKKMEPLIYEIAKGDPEDLARLKNILNSGTNHSQTPKADIPTTPTQAPKNIQGPIIEESAQEQDSATFMGKLKGMLDLFNTKK